MLGRKPDLQELPDWAKGQSQVPPTAMGTHSLWQATRHTYWQTLKGHGAFYSYLR